MLLLNAQEIVKMTDFSASSDNFRQNYLISISVPITLLTVSFKCEECMHVRRKRVTSVDEAYLNPNSTEYTHRQIRKHTNDQIPNKLGIC